MNTNYYPQIAQMDADGASGDAGLSRFLSEDGGEG